MVYEANFHAGDQTGAKAREEHNGFEAGQIRRGGKTMLEQSVSDDALEPLWSALVKRDQRFRGVVFYGVVTTGVFCRPGCPSRLPRRENVRFFLTAKEAKAGGFRACLRCKPESEDQRPERELANACDALGEAARNGQGVGDEHGSRCSLSCRSGDCSRQFGCQAGG